MQVQIAVELSPEQHAVLNGLCAVHGVTIADALRNQGLWALASGLNDRDFWPGIAADVKAERSGAGCPAWAAFLADRRGAIVT